MTRLKFLAQKSLQQSVLILFCLFNSQISYAFAGELYQVEVLVFQNLTQSTGEVEAWPANPALPELAGSVLLLPKNPEKSEPFQLLPESELNLQDEAKAISTNPNYRLLLHLAWRQPVRGDGARPVHLFAMEPVDNPYALLSYSKDLPWVLDGTLAFHRTNYIVMKADLVFNKKQAQNNNTQSGFVNQTKTLSIRMHEKRRMRRQELHFIDNPAFGMLVRLVPYEPKPSATLVSDDSGSE